MNDMFILFGATKPHLQRVRLAAGAFVFEHGHAFLKNAGVLLKIVNIMCFVLFLKPSNRRGTQLHSGRRSNFVLSSHLESIGDQNDV